MCDLRCVILDVRKRHGRRDRCARRISCGDSATSDIINQTSHISHSSGVTLIELLIAIAIMATLSVMFLGASRAAMEHSRASRTKMTISKLHTLLMEQWASYETRRVDTKELGLPHADEQLLGKRELMKLEMPDKWSDITGVKAGDLPRTDTAFLRAVKDLPTLAKIYRRRYQSPNISAAFEGAECLYMVIMYACGDGESRTMFAGQDIGDVDEDGAPEFLDGWGRPIGFIRWPAGFVGVSAVMSGDFDGDHDPFDPFNRDQPSSGSSVTDFNDPDGAYRLVPLIYSLGPDEETGILILNDPNDPAIVESINPYLKNPNDFQNGSLRREGDVQSGKVTTDHIDNIHNHLQEGR